MTCSGNTSSTGLKQRSLDQLPAGCQDAGLNQLDRVLSALGHHRRQADASEPHRILAGLPLPLFLTANPDYLLSDALVEAGKAPKQGLCPWKSQIKNPADLASFVPSAQEPLVYHLMGRMNDHRTMVLTEDDYIQYLIELAGRRDLVPGEAAHGLERVRAGLPRVPGRTLDVSVPVAELVGADRTGAGVRTGRGPGRPRRERLRGRRACAAVSVQGECPLAATKLCRSTGARPAISSSSWTSSGDDAGFRRGPPYDQES